MTKPRKRSCSYYSQDFYSNQAGNTLSDHEAVWTKETGNRDGMQDLRNGIHRIT